MRLLSYWSSQKSIMTAHNGSWHSVQIVTSLEDNGQFIAFIEQQSGHQSIARRSNPHSTEWIPDTCIEARGNEDDIRFELFDHRQEDILPNQ